MKIMNMPIVCTKGAEIKIYEFKCRAVFCDTYNEFERVWRLARDWF